MVANRVNPAGDAIADALPKNGVQVIRQRALPHTEVGAAVARVKDSGNYPDLALAFGLLVPTACRNGEVRIARWSEIDPDGAG
ncbi:MAG: hypothetical protein OXU72_07515 [Gammaproteobacteria bacterium]|nr:hypothetical protein [Gammaproteobacteria bacterium]